MTQRHETHPNLRTLIPPALFLALAGSTYAADPLAAIPLPYATRTRPYSAYQAGTRGDIRTVGMAGATVGLADTFAAAGENPAGLALTLNVGDTHASASEIRDRSIQRSEAPLLASSAGAALQVGDWGYSLGVVTPWEEGQFFNIPGQSEPLLVDLYTREIRAGVARRWSDLGLAVGAQVRFGTLHQTLGPATSEFDNPDLTTHAMGLTFGALYRLPERFLLGASVMTPMRYEPGIADSRFNALPGINQPALSPFKASLGLGYIPNRLFRADLTLQWVGPTTGAATLADQSLRVGSSSTVEPRVGAAYVFGDFRSMRATAFAGSYLDPGRVASVATRLHGTAGVELKWSFMNFGLGLDVATGYQNRLASIGVDPFTVMERLGLIPRPPARKPRGFLSPFMYRSDEGLPDSLRDGPRKSDSEPGIDPVQIGTQLPRKLGEKVRNLRPGQVINTLKELPSEIGGDLEEVTQEIQKSLDAPAKPRTRRRFRPVPAP